MIKRLLVFLLLGVWFYGKAQCPQVYNYLGTPTLNPQFISCTGNAYVLNYQSPSSFGSYTINWGDASANNTGAAYTANALITHTYAATVNTFVITLSIPSAACTMTSLVVLEKPVNASIQIPTLGITQACAPKTLTFTNSSTDVSATTSFTWNFGDGTPPVVVTSTNVGQNMLHQYNRYTVNCQTQVTLQAKNYCSFNNPTIANFNPIQIYDVDSAIITPDRLLRCWPDAAFTFSNTSQRNCLTQGNTFQRRERWNFGNYWGLNHDSIINWSPWPPTSPRTVSYPSVGNYTVMLQDSNLCGVSSRVISVIIVNSPTAGVVAPGGFLCQNTPLTFTNTSSTGYAYLWNFGTSGTFTNLGGGNKTFTYPSAGNYTVRVVAFIPNGGGSCTDTASAPVTILSSPVASFAVSPNTGCNSINSATFTDQSTGANSWNWTFGNGATSTLQVPPIQNFTVVGGITASLLVTAATGCSNTATQTLIVRPKPIPAFTQFTTCVNAPVTFTNLSSITGTNPITSYTWSFGDGSSLSNSTTPIKTYSAPSTYTVKLKVASAFCIDSLSQTVSINVKPTANFAHSPTLSCPPLLTTFTNSSSNASAYLWKFGAAGNPTSSASNPTFSFGNSTQSFQNYTITLIASTGFGCSDSIKKSVSVRPKPIANYTTNTATGCSPLVTTFSSTSTGAGTYSYTFGDGGSSALQNPAHTYSNATLFTQTVSAQLVVTNSVGCTDTLKKVITIYPEALPIFTMLPASGCSPLTVNFPSVPGVATYTWNHGDGSPTFTTLTAHNFTYVNTGSVNLVYTVSLIALTSNGCVGSDSKTVTIFPNPVANISFSPATGCSPLSVNYTNTSSGSVNSFWQFFNGQTSNIANPTTTFTNSIGTGPITYSVKLRVSSVNGCNDSIVKPITLLPLPKAGFGLDTPACAPKVISFTNTTQGGNTYKWTFGDGGTSTQAAPAHLYSNGSIGNVPYTVKLVAISTELCRDSISTVMYVHPKPTYFISSAPDSGCSPLKVFFPKINGVVRYEWKYDNIAFGSNGDISNTFENKTSLIKNFNVQLIGSDVFNCSDTATKTIRVFPKPTAKFIASPLTVYVPNQSTQFTNQSISAASYTWSFGDGGSSKEFNPSHTYTSPGQYQIRLIVTSNKGCRDTFLLPETVVALDETSVEVPNAFTPNPNGSPGTKYNPKDLSNDIFHPNIKGTEKYTLSIYSRWGELLFETKDPEEGWDGYYKGKLCTQDVYIWKVTATFVDGKTYSKTGDLLLLK